MRHLTSLEDIAVEFIDNNESYMENQEWFLDLLDNSTDEYDELTVTSLKSKTELNK